MEELFEKCGITEQWQKEIIFYTFRNKNKNLSVDDYYKMLWSKNLRIKKKTIKEFIESDKFKKAIGDEEYLISPDLIKKAIDNLYILMNSENEKIRLEASRIILKYQMSKQPRQKKRKLLLSPIGLPLSVEPENKEEDEEIYHG
jgi:hypothetical protein